MTILLLETATQVCSVAMLQDRHIVASRESDEPNAHSSRLAVFVKELLAESPQRPDAVCVSSGPGSYTGLRIGVSSAKGLCYGLDIPLLAVPTLQSMAAWYYMQHPEYDGLVCPMIDARRLECYTALFSRDAQLRDTAADIIEPGLYDQWLDNHPVVFIGDGAAKTQPLLGTHRNALYDSSFVVNAAGMSLLAEQKLKAGDTEDVAYFEPFYLKDFVAKKSEVHGLRTKQ
ncbi:MAG: tRNA (adenosine(37)-N6)-threonylcarbamoyltransferase complex dimerization subunit type 1 TsaB [Bacteroidales bacterium]|nr:tRNA (adenosine(37)-N6)-threonylcarbamoyltransferase complex dimerization subunit type 1 TsaB [Bacteroidales bacterium]